MVPTTTSEINSILLVVALLSQQFLGLLGYATGDGTLRDGETFDFIVVGGGTGGNTVAGRLAESGQHTVLLIEEGGIPHPDLEVPALSVNHVSDPNTVKVYQTVPQRDAGLVNNGVVDFTRGRVLGGSSAINFMMFNRGSPQDYNNWGRVTGDPSWNYPSMLKYFRKYENYSGDYPSDQRGFNGPISIERRRYAPGVDQWLQAGRELGYEIAEPNGPQRMSFTAMDFNHRFGRRVSSYKAYIEPMLQSSSPSSLSASLQPRRVDNLLILINTQANRIIFEGNRAVGVKFTTNSTHIGHARARKEIIVSAGAIESPALLMRSGVGPKPFLDSARIPAVKYLPVGKNLMDHAVATVFIVLGNRSAAFIPDSDLNPSSWRMFNEFGDGPYTSTFGVMGQAFLFSSVISSHERKLGWPDLQLFPQMTNRPTSLGAGLSDVSDLKDWEVAVQWSTYVARPKSRGTVTLDPKNIDNSPMIDFQYFSHPDDMQVMIDGIKVSLEVCEETSAFRRIGCRVPTDVLPACSRHKFRSDSYWKCYARQMTGTGIHASGTCKMGSGPEDPQAVVDSQLRVIGIEGLTVADASIMPAVTNANTQAAVYVIGEKAADMILTRWEGLKINQRPLQESTSKSAADLRQLLGLLH